MGETANGSFYYGTVDDADEYFAERLHETDWSGSNPTDKEKALLAATRSIDRLRFKLDKADADQPLAFPRGEDTEPPAAILTACFEEAHELLSGKDAGRELESLSILAEGIGSTNINRSVTGDKPEHLANGIVSWLAWRELKPFLADIAGFRFNPTDDE
jgi:hypothetical protein